MRSGLIAAAALVVMTLASCVPARQFATTHAPVSPAVIGVGDRAAHTATLLPDGGLLVAGGCVVDGCSTATAESMIVTGEQVDATSDMTQSRDAHTATLLPDGSVFIAGGFPAEGEKPLASTERFDPSSSEWSPAAELDLGRGGHAAALLGDGRVLIAGGWIDLSTYTASTELYDPASDTLAPGPELPVALDGIAAVPLADGRALITGGQAERGVATDTAIVVSADGSSATEIRPLGAARFKHTMVVLPDDRVLVIGGTSDDVQLLTSTELFDPASLTFTPGPQLRSGRYKLGGGAAVLGDGRVAVWGGGPGVELLDVAAGTSSAFPGAPHGVASFGTATATDGRVTFIGGYDEQIRLVETFLVLPEPD